VLIYPLRAPPISIDNNKFDENKCSNQFLQNKKEDSAKQKTKPKSLKKRSRWRG
jgi:hypothetical protein